MITSPRGWKRPAALVALTALTLGGLALGSTALAAPGGSHSSSHHPGAGSALADQPAAAHVFAHNAKGLTYGSELDATDPAHAPDLIEAYATNGKLGYVLAKQLHPSVPSGPAAALQAQTVNKAATHIPVYALDGQTQIGVYDISPPSGS